MLCGFDKALLLHHIIKREEYGSSSEKNLIYLCPNCHYMAHSPEYEEEIKKEIFEKTGKKGEVLNEEIIQRIKEYVKKKTGTKENDWAFQTFERELTNSGGFHARLNRGIIR